MESTKNQPETTNTSATLRGAVTERSRSAGQALSAGNEQQTTDNKQQTTNNEQPTTNNQQPTTNNQQRTTNNQQPTTNNEQPTTNNQQPTTNNEQRTTNNQQPTTNNQQLTTNIFRFLGSIKLAVPLLATIVGILIWATLYEAQVGSPTVQYEIYKSPWFGALMFLLALNLGMAALNRYPWRGFRKIGFAIAHLGLIVIIAGSAAVIHLGVEGLIPLRVNSGLSNQIRAEGEFIEVMDSQGTIQQADLFIKPDGSVNVNRVGELSLIDYTDNAIETIKFVETETVENPAVRLSLHSDRMGQTLERWIAASPEEYRKIALGPAELELISVENETQLQALISPPQEEENLYPWGKLQFQFAQGEEREISIQENLSKTIELENNVNNVKVKIINFWPDFQLDENRQPITLSQQVRNPVVQLEIEAQEGREKMLLFGNGQFNPVRYLVSGEKIESVKLDYQVQLQDPEDYFRVITTPTKELYYTAHSSGGFKSGSLEIGQSTTPGWADFQITLEEVIPHARPQREVVPLNNPAIEAIPALLVETEQSKTWLPWGQATTIEGAEGETLVAFGPKIIQLPFAIALEDFIIDRNEGEESIAMWTSKIRIEDRERQVITRRDVWMNHPTWYQGWKIAQASWNPNDLQQSTLQVKREPIWVTGLTWSGSMLIVVGIIIMFYGSSLTKKVTGN